MSNYTQVTDFSAKDSLVSGDPEKAISGFDVDGEFAAISTAIATKSDSPATSAMSFNDADYIAAAQIVFIRDNDTASQTAATVTSGVQAMFAAAITYLNGANSRVATLDFSGSYAISDELITEASAQVIWDTTKTECRLIVRGGSFYATGWASHKAVRTSGLYSGITDNVPMVMLRWECDTKSQFRLDLRDVSFYGETDHTTDPMGVKLMNHNDGHHINVRIEDFYNTALFIEDINNTRFVDWVIGRCGYQPTQAAGDGFIPAGTTVTATAGAGTTTVDATASIFTSAHTGKWLMIEDVGESGTTISGVMTYVSGTQVTIDEQCIAGGPFAGKAFSFATLRGDFNANTTVTLDTEVTDDLDGRYIYGFKAGSAVHTDQDLYVGLVASHDLTTGIVLKDACANTVSGVPILVGPAVYIGRSEDADAAGHNNDTQFFGLRVEHSFNTVTGSACMMVAQNVLRSQFYGTKLHGTDEAYNNFAANEFNLVVDNCKHLQMPNLQLDHGEWSPDYAKIVVMGEFNTLFFEDIGTGNQTPMDRTADFYLDPKTSAVEDCQVYVSGRVGRQTGDWGLTNQAFSRFGSNGSQLMMGSCGPLITRDLSTFADQPSNQWITWTVAVHVGGADITAGGGTYSSRTGKYRIIDGMCEVYFTFLLSAKGTNTGNVTIPMPATPVLAGEAVPCSVFSNVTSVESLIVGSTNVSLGLTLNRITNTTYDNTTTVSNGNITDTTSITGSGRFRVV